MSRRHIITAALAIALSACRDGTAPDPGVDIAISVSEFNGPTLSEDADGPVITCDIGLRAVASGKGSATWLDATFKVYLGADRTTPVDSAVFSDSEIREAWGGDAIAAGETRQSQWTLAAPIPLSATLEFRYQPSIGHNVKSTKVSFSCAPTIPPNAAPPEISALSVTPPSGEIPVGGPLEVSYAASGQAGLWLTDVRVSGPCETRVAFAERLQTSAARTARVPLPPECRLGVPITVTIDALDAAGRLATRALTTQLVVADKEPPTVSPLFFSTYFPAAQPTLSGNYFAGDSIQIIFNAQDNYRLAALVWEVLPFGKRDSILVSGRAAGPYVWVRLDPKWSGPIQLRLYARDSVGLTSAPFTTHPDSVWVAGTVQRPTRTATVTGETRDFAVDIRRGLIYLAQGNDRRLAVFSMATMQLTGTLSLPAVPTDLDLTAGGDSLLLVLYGRPELGVVDLRQSPLALSTLPLPELDAAATQAPVGVRVGSNGRAYVTLGGSTQSARTMIEVDLATGTTRPLPLAGAGGSTGVGILERSHDRSVLTLTAVDPWCMQRYDVGADAFSPCVSTIPRDLRPSVDGTGQRIAVSLDVYDASLRRLAKVGPPLLVGPYAVFSALSVDGESLFTILWPNIVRVRASDNRVLDRTPNPIQPSLIRVSPDGTLLITVESNYGATTKISLIDLR
jgi:hypothetical protein